MGIRETDTVHAGSSFARKVHFIRSNTSKILEKFSFIMLIEFYNDL